MNGTMFNIAVPDIANTYDLLPSEASWVMTGYIMIYAVGALVYGKLADYYPYKTLITIGLTIFSLGSLLGFFSTSYVMVIVGRIIQAMGGSMIPALVFLAPIRYFPDQRGKVLGIISSVMAFASGVGPILGGFIAGFLSWEYLFLTSALIIVTLPFLRKNLPNEETKPVSLDYIGMVFVAGIVSSLILGISLGLMYMFGIMALFILFFIWRTKTARDPFIPPRLFRNVNYRTTIITSFLTITSLFGMMFILPLMFRDVYGLSTMSIGLVLFPGAMSAAIMGQKGGNLVDSKGAKFVLFLALGLLFSGFLVVSSATGLVVWLVSALVILAYMSFPLVQASSAELLATELESSETGVGMGVFNLLNFVSGSISGAVIGKVLDLYQPSSPINPIGVNGESAIYSNVFLGFSIVILVAFLQFKFFYKKKA